MPEGDSKKLLGLLKLVKCERCDERFPTDSELAQICDLRKQNTREHLASTQLGFCVCPQRLWQRKPHLVAAVLAAKYPKMNWETPTGKNRTARWIIKRLASNSKRKALSVNERRTLYEFREKGREILYQWCLEFPEVDIPLIVFLDNLMSNPLTKLLGQEPHTPADMDKFMKEVAENPSLLYTLLLSEVTGRVAWRDENPHGYDPDGRKEELYNGHPEYQAILDGMIDEYGYDECVAELASYGFSPPLDECEIAYEEAKSEKDWALDPVEIEKDRELTAAEMDKLRARVIIALKRRQYNQ